MNPGHGLGRAARFQFLASVTRSGLLLVHQWLLAWAYGPGAFGICNAALAGWQTATMVGRAAGDTVVLRQTEGADPHHPFPPLGRALTLSLAAGALAGLALGLWGFAAQSLSRQPLTLAAFILAGVAVPLATALFPLGAALQRQRRFLAFAFTNTALDPVIRVAALGGAVVIGAHWLSAMSSVVLGALAATAVATALLRPALRGLPVSLGPAGERGAILRFSSVTTLAAACQNAMLFSALSLATIFSTPADTAALAAAARVAMLALWIQIAFATPFLPTIPVLAHDPARRPELQSVYTRVVASVMWANAPLLVGLAVGGPALLRVFGPAFVRGAPLLAILAAAQWVNSATALAEDFLPLTGRSGLALANNAGALAVTTVGGWVLAPRLGVLGIAVAYGTAVVGLNALRAWQIWHLTRVGIPAGTLLRAAAASLVGVATAVILPAGAPAGVPGGLARGAAAGAVTLLAIAAFASSVERRAFRTLVRGID